MKKSILKSSLALAVAGVFGATVAVNAADISAAEEAQAQQVPVTQQQQQDREASQAQAPVPTIQTTATTQGSATAQSPTDTKVVRPNTTGRAATTTKAAAAVKTDNDKKADSKNAKKADRDVKADPSDKAAAKADKSKNDKNDVKNAKADKNSTPRDARNGQQPQGDQNGVVDQNSVFVVGANYLLDEYTNKFGDSKMSSVSFKNQDNTGIYEVAGFNNQGAHNLTLDVATSAVTEGPAKPYDASLEATAIDPGSVLPPHVAINAGYAQTNKKAVKISSWSLSNQNGKALYNIQFLDAQNQPINVVLDAKTGETVSANGAGGAK